MYNLFSEPCHSIFCGKKPKDVAFVNYLHSSHNIFDRIIMHRIERTIKGNTIFPLAHKEIDLHYCRDMSIETMVRDQKTDQEATLYRFQCKAVSEKSLTKGQCLWPSVFVVCCFSFLYGLRYLHKLEIFAQTPSTYQRQD